MENNIAVLIDFENLAAGVEKEGLGKLEIGLIMNRLRERGRVLVARSYADWGRFARHKKVLLFEGISLFELSAHGTTVENAATSRLLERAAAASALADLVAVLDAALLADLPSVVQPVVAAPASAAASTAPNATATSDHKPWLWAALGVGLLLLAGMAASLLKQIKLLALVTRKVFFQPVPANIGVPSGDTGAGTGRIDEDAVEG